MVGVRQEVPMGKRLDSLTLVDIPICLGHADHLTDAVQRVWLMEAFLVAAHMFSPKAQAESADDATRHIMPSPLGAPVLYHPKGHFSVPVPRKGALVDTAGAQKDVLIINDDNIGIDIDHMPLGPVELLLLCTQMPSVVRRGRPRLAGPQTEDIEIIKGVFPVAGSSLGLLQG